MPEILSIDHIEGGIAICERDDRTIVEIPLGLLPEGVKPGDCIAKTADGYELDPAETARRRKENIDLFKKLKKKEGAK